MGRGETDEWWPETGLNRRRRPFQGRALPLSYLASVQTINNVAFPRADSGETGEVGLSTYSVLQQLSEYINSPPLRPNSAWFRTILRGGNFAPALHW